MGTQIHIQMYLQIIMNGKYNIILECENGECVSPILPVPSPFRLTQLILSWKKFFSLLFLVFFFAGLAWLLCGVKEANERGKKERGE